MEEDIYENPDEEIRRYGPKVIIIHWAVIAFFIPLAITGLLLARDWFFVTFSIFGGDLWVETFEGAIQLHVASGVILAVLGLVHVLIHLKQEEKPILPRNIAHEFKATFETAMWATFISRQKEGGSAEKYMASQRMSYVATYYTLGLSAFTAIFIFTLGETGSAVHVVAGALVAFLAAFRIMFLLRQWDGIAIKCIMWTGTMPLWYVKENHYLWYLKLKGIDESTAIKPKEPEGPEPTPEPAAPEPAPAAVAD